MVKKIEHKTRYDRSVNLLLAAMIVFLVNLFIAGWPPRTGSLEVGIINTIYNWPLWLKPYFYAVTQLVSFYAVTAVVIILWIRRHRVLAYVVATASIFTFALTEILKILVRRPRPPQALTHIVSRDSMAYGFGFPSGHAAVSTLLCVLLWDLVPKNWRWLLVVGVVLVCLSRIYLGVHAPLDIVGGICIGLTIGLVIKLPMLKIKDLRFND